MNREQLLAYLENPDLPVEAAVSHFQSLVERYPYFQAGWMLYAKSLKVAQRPEWESVLRQAALRVSDRKKLFSFVNGKAALLAALKSWAEIYSDIADYPLPPDETVQQERHSERENKGDLIDSFLAASPTFRNRVNLPGEVPDYDLSEKAVSENDAIVTETFVRLLITQQKYQKAIEAFEKLSLKIPEKSIYFAAQIEEVKKLMNH